MRRMTMRRIIVVGATAGAVLLTGGVAFAFWSSSGTAAGAAEVAANAASLTVEQPVGSAPSNLSPGGDPQDVTVTVTNPSGTDIALTDVTVAVTATTEAATAVGECEIDDFAIVDNPDYDGEILLANGGTTTFVAATIQLTETGVIQDACKDAGLTLSLTAS